MAGIACADIDDRVQERCRFGFEVGSVVIVPGVIGTFTAGHAIEDFAVNHRIDGLAVSRDFAAGHSPEVSDLRAGAGGFRVRKMIRAHLQTGAFAASHVAGEVGIGETGAFGGFSESEGHSVTVDTRPVDVALEVCNVDAEQTVGGVISARVNGSEYGHGGGDSKCCFD